MASRLHPVRSPPRTRRRNGHGDAKDAQVVEVPEDPSAGAAGTVRSGGTLASARCSTRACRATHWPYRVITQSGMIACANVPLGTSQRRPAALARVTASDRDDASSLR